MALQSSLGCHGPACGGHRQVRPEDWDWAPGHAPRSPALLTGRRHCPERGGPGISENYLQRVSTRFQPVPPKSSVTVYSCEIVRRNNSGRDPSLEPLKRQVGLRRNADSPKHILGRPRLGAFRRVCGPCDSADTSRPAGFGDHRGRAAYLTAVRIKVYSIPKGRFPMSEACSWESRLFSFKQTYHCFVLGATGGFITQIKRGRVALTGPRQFGPSPTGSTRQEAGSARALPAVSELQALAAGAADCIAGRRPEDSLPSTDSLNTLISGWQRPEFRTQSPSRLGGFLPGGSWESRGWLQCPEPRSPW